MARRREIIERIIIYALPSLEIFFESSTFLKCSKVDRYRKKSCGHLIRRMKRIVIH